MYLLSTSYIVSLVFKVFFQCTLNVEKCLHPIIAHRSELLLFEEGEKCNSPKRTSVIYE